MKSGIRQAGFSLIEMAVVLAVLAVVVGGVVVGRQVMERAEYAKFEADARQYANALTEFEKTYNGLPGDIPNATSFFPSLPPGANGNGNGVIDPAEQTMFWQHMQVSGLLQKSITPVTETSDPAGSRDGTGYNVVQDPQLGMVMELSAYKDEGAGMSGGFAAFTPDEVAAMEARDDGNPASGKVRARLGGGAVGNCTVQTVAGGVTTTSLDQTNKQKACIVQFVAAELAVNNTDVQEEDVASCGLVGQTRTKGSCPAGYTGEILDTCTPTGWQETKNCVITDCGGGVYQQLRYTSCGAGYVGVVTEQCGAGGVWQPTNNTCVPSSGACSVLNEERTRNCAYGKTGTLIERCNGTVWVTLTNNCTVNSCAGSTVGTTRLVSCPTGYTGTNGMTETCTSAGVWDSVPGKSDCVLSAGDACTPDGSTRTINCQPGKAGAVSQTCKTVNGALAWVTTQDTCKTVMCGDKPVGTMRDTEKECTFGMFITEKERCASDGSWQLVSGGCPTPADCPLPWGGTTPHGSTVSAYSVGSVVSPATCPASTTRTCNNGVLDGVGNFAACNVTPPADCALPWGGSIASGSSVTAFSVATVNWPAACPAGVSRLCTNGLLGGSGNFSACTVTPPAGCTPGAPVHAIGGSRSYTMREWSSGASWVGCLIQY